MIGGTLLAIGIAMIVLPGPAIIVVPLGLGVLGLEFAWARYWLRKLRATATDVVNRVRRRPKGKVTVAPTGQAVPAPHEPRLPHEPEAPRARERQEP